MPAKRLSTARVALREADLPPNEDATVEALQTTGRPLSLDFLIGRPGYVFRRASLFHSARLEEILSPLGIRRSHYVALLVIKHHPGAPPSALADTLLVARANIVSQIDDLVQRGLIERRERSDDRRFRSLHLTRKGKALIDKIEPTVTEFEQNLANEINASGTDVLQALYAWLKANRVA